jgi:hypothetical protein
MLAQEFVPLVSGDECTILLSVAIPFDGMIVKKTV